MYALRLVFISMLVWSFLKQIMVGWGFAEEIYSQPGISPVSSEVEVVQPDFNDSNAKENAEESSEGFESLNPVEKFHLPATEEEEDLASTDTSIQVLSGKTSI